MPDPVMLPQQKAETAFLQVLEAAIDAGTLSGFKSHTAGQDERGLPAFAVNAKDMPEYPKFTGNMRGNLEVKVMTDADENPDIEDDHPAANHARNIGLVGDALRPTDDITLEALLTTAARDAGLEFTCLLCEYMGAGEQTVVGKHFESTHVFKVWIAPSNV